MKILGVGLMAATLGMLASCSQYGRVSYAEAPKVINVSEYDPKERQRGGSDYSPLNQAALKRNGSHGMIARCGKGLVLDRKCADFLVGAERQGMLLGTYYYLLPRISARSQADQYIARLRSIKRSRGLQTKKVLLVADMDTKCTVEHMIAFLKRVRELTGVVPVVYLENSDRIRRELNSASGPQKSFLRQHPYWLALYSDGYTGLETPQKLADASGIWSSWAMWQYGGVWWERGRSVPHYYRGGSWQTPKYFGDLSRPCERNGFNGSVKELYAFWGKHSWAW